MMPSGYRRETPIDHPSADVPPGADHSPQPSPGVPVTTESLARALDAARRQVHAALLAGEVGTFEWDIVEQRVWGDLNFARMFGIAFDDDGTAPLERYIDVIHPDDRARMRIAVARTVEDGADYEVEYRVLVNGSTRWLLVRAKPERAPAADGRVMPVVRAYGVCLDVTARRAAEYESRRGLRLLQTISDATGDVIYAKDRTGRLTYGNPATFALIGKPGEEVIGRTDAEVLNDVDAARRVMENDARIMASGEPEEIEEVVPLPDGTQRVWLSSKRPYLDEHGEVAGLLGVSRDITEYVEARRRLAAALTVGEVGVFEWDIASGRITGDANFARLFGVTMDARGSAPLQAFLDAVHRDDLAGLTARIRHSLETGEPYEAEYRIRSTGTCGPVEAPNGDCWVVARGGVEFDAITCRPVRVPGTVLDISARVAAETAERAARAVAEVERARAVEARRVAEAANAAKAKFLAKISHELRTPLHGIGAHVQLVELGIHGPVTEAQSRALAGVQQAKDQLISLVSDVLNYAKIEAGHEHFAMQAVDLGSVVDEVALLVEPQRLAKGLTFDARLDGAAREVLADREKLRRILLNLIGNAIKFTAPVNAVTGAPGRIEVGVSPVSASGADGLDELMIALHVRDTGVGIPAHQLEAIFEPFVQLRQPGAAEPEGTGLGLSISRDLARAMGGDLSVESQVGHGTTFSVRLRRSDVTAA